MTQATRARTRRTKFAALAFAVAVGPVALLANGSTAGASSAPSGPESQASGSQASDSQRRLVVAPGRIGPAKAGMTVRRAMRTGMFRRNVPNPPCGRIKLQPKGKLKRHMDTVVVRGRLVEMGVFTKRLRTRQKTGVGTQLRRLRKVYGKRLSRPRKAGYGQWAVYVDRKRRHIGFLLGNAYVADGKPGPRRKVTFMAVNRGKRPNLMRDGC